MCRPRSAPQRSTTPRSARLSASVPDPVKTISRWAQSEHRGDPVACAVDGRRSRSARMRAPTTGSPELSSGTAASPRAPAARAGSSPRGRGGCGSRRGRSRPQHAARTRAITESVNSVVDAWPPRSEVEMPARRASNRASPDRRRRRRQRGSGANPSRAAGREDHRHRVGDVLALEARGGAVRRLGHHHRRDQRVVAEAEQQRLGRRRCCRRAAAPGR